MNAVYGGVEKTFVYYHHIHSNQYYVTKGGNITPEIRYNLAYEYSDTLREVKRKLKQRTIK